MLEKKNKGVNTKQETRIKKKVCVNNSNVIDASLMQSCLQYQNID